MAIVAHTSSTAIQPSELPQFIRALRVNELCHDDIDLSKHHYCKVELAGETVGYYGIEKYKNDGLLRSVVILEAFRNQGLGKELIAHVDDLCAQLNLGFIISSHHHGH